MINTVKVDNLPGPFEVEVPEIYQIEVSSVCNFNCIMCPRKLFKRKDKTKFIELSLIDKLIKEDAFRGSYFVELQMSGEPTLHPQLETIITRIKETGCKVGLSTNGSSLPDPRLLLLDYITISIDTVDVNQVIRKGRKANFIPLVLDFIQTCRDKGGPVIDLQIVDLTMTQPVQQFQFTEVYKQVEDVFIDYLSEGVCNLRVVPDCFLTKFHKPDRLPVKEQICLNPWLSVSIQSNGNVTACCFSFGDDIILGNLRENTLSEIWKGEKVKQLRKEHETKQYRPICAHCYMRSPVLLHWNIFTSSLKTKGGN